MVRILGVARSGYYQYIRKKPSNRQQDNQLLLEATRAIFTTHRETYGSPRIHAELIAQGMLCSRNRVARLMRKAHLVAKMRKCFKRTTRVDGKHKVANNLLRQDFIAAKPNQKWVSDITYVKTQEGWLYVAIVLDLFSRRVVGLAMGESLHTSLVLKALQQALWRRKPTYGLCHHSDRGCQYTSEAYQNLLAANGIACSMSGTGNCYDNAVAESFFHTLKTESVSFTRYATREEAKSSIFEYIEVFYNNQRRHSTLGYLSPTEFERRFIETLCY